MQFELPLFRQRVNRPEVLQVGLRAVPVEFVRHRRARRYILRLSEESVARITIPRGGSEKTGLEFARRQIGWLERQLARRARQPAPPRFWTAGTEILFGGEPASLRVSADGRTVQLADQTIAVGEPEGDLRPAVERHLWRLARVVLVKRTLELAAAHGVRVARVRVGNQRSRWGSCSVKGTVSLNWRLIQTPPFVRDYLIMHELMHLREMNHSARFWQLVRAACPEFERAESWLDQHARWLG